MDKLVRLFEKAKSDYARTHDGGCFVFFALSAKRTG